MLSYLVFFFGTVFYVVLDHTGYLFLPNATEHDLHYEKVNSNFVGLVAWYDPERTEGCVEKTG